MAVSWINNAVKEATIKATVDNTFKVKLPVYAPKLSVVINGQSKSLPVSDGILTLTLQKGDIAVLGF